MACLLTVGRARANLMAFCTRRGRSIVFLLLECAHQRKEDLACSCRVNRSKLEWDRGCLVALAVASILLGTVASREMRGGGAGYGKDRDPLASRRAGSAGTLYNGKIAVVVLPK